MTLTERKHLARGVLAGFERMEPWAVRTLAAGLSLVGGPLGALAMPLDSYADQLEYEDVSGALAVLGLARALTVIGRDPDCPELLNRLEELSEPPWPALRDALRSEGRG